MLQRPAQAADASLRLPRHHRSRPQHEGDHVA